MHLDHADPRRGSREHRRNRKKQKTRSFCTSITPMPAEGRARTAEIELKCTSITPIPAEGRASTAEIGKKKQKDHADPRRGSRQHRRNRKKPRVLAPRPRRSPQRVARAPQKSQKTSSFCTSTTPIPAEGRASTAEIVKSLKFLHLDHADPRRGSREHRRNHKKTKVLAPRPRRSPQRVARAPQKS